MTDDELIKAMQDKIHAEHNEAEKHPCGSVDRMYYRGRASVYAEELEKALSSGTVRPSSSALAPATRLRGQEPLSGVLSLPAPETLG